MAEQLTHTVYEFNNTLHFRSADVADMNYFIAMFIPAQNGSGDPSPTNIRTFRSGWT